MKVLKSHRDAHFLKWNKEDVIRFGYLSPVARFEYVSIKSMQRGDVTQESEAWLKKNKEQNFNLIEVLRESIPKHGMISPIILVSTQNKHWAEFVGKNFWSHIPMVIQTGNNRYRVAVEEGYTHISSIIFGSTVDPRVFNYMQTELKKPLGEVINVDKQSLVNYFGWSLFTPEESLI